MKCYLFINYNLDEAIFYTTNSNLQVFNFLLQFFDFLLRYLPNEQLFILRSFLVKREPQWMRALILDPVFLLKFKIPNSDISEVEYAVGSDQNALLVNAYFLKPTIGIFWPNPSNPDIEPLVGKEGNQRPPIWLMHDNSSSEENKS
jgi:hypothetical protein